MLDSSEMGPVGIEPTIFGSKARAASFPLVVGPVPKCRATRVFGLSEFPSVSAVCSRFPFWREQSVSRASSLPIDPLRYRAHFDRFIGEVFFVKGPTRLLGDGAVRRPGQRLPSECRRNVA